MRRRIRAISLALGGFLLASSVYLSPMLIDPATRAAGGRGDPMLVAYIVTWVADHLWTTQAWNPPFLHPAPNVLAYSDHMYGLSVLAWPAVAAGMPPVAIVNTISWLAFFLTSAAIFWWLLDSRGDVLPSAAAAVTVTYCAWRAQQLPHPHLLFVPLLPLALLCFTRAIERRGPPWIVWVGAAALAAQTVLVASLAILVLPLTAVWVVVALAIERRAARAAAAEPASAARDLRLWASLGLALIAAGLANLPAAFHYWSLGAAFERSPIDVARFSVGWQDWLSAPAPHWLYGESLTGTRGLERELFPGLGFLIILIVGAVAAIRAGRAGRAVWPGMVTALVAIWAAAGPSPPLSLSLAHAPYDAMAALVPGGRQVRVPARFVVVAALFLAPAVAAGWAQVHRWLARAVPSVRAAGALAIVLVIVTVAEGLPGLAVYEDVTYLDAKAVPRAAISGGVIFLPVSDDPADEIRRMWLARQTGVPVANGYSGHPSYLWQAVRTLQDGAADDDTRRVLYSRLLREGVDTVVVADAPAPSALVDPAALRPLAEGVYRIAPPPVLPRVRVFRPGRGVGALVPEFGWSYPEGDARDSWMWTLDRTATFLVPMDGSPIARMTLRVRGLHPDFRERLVLWWNDRMLGARTLRRDAEVLTFQLPEDATRAGWQRFELRGPPPIRAPEGSDYRRLSVCVYEIALQ